MNSGDIVISLIIAIVIILIYFFVFPGLYKVNTYNLDGYWANSKGNIYKLIPTSNYYFEIISSGETFEGHLFGIQGIYITETESKGTIQTDNRFINWSNGDIWTKQAY